MVKAPVFPARPGGFRVGAPEPLCTPSRSLNPESGQHRAATGSFSFAGHLVVWADVSRLGSRHHGRGGLEVTVVRAALVQTTWRGNYVGEKGDPHKPELIIRDLDLDLIGTVRERWAFYRDRRPDAYDDLVRP